MVEKAVRQLEAALLLSKNACKSFFRSLASETGSTIIYPLLFAGVASGIVLTVGNLFLQQQTLVTDLNTKLALTIIRSNFTTILSDDTAWAETLKNATNDSLKCIRDGTSCADALNKINSIPILIAPDGTVFYDSQNSNAGLSREGTSCDSYKTSGYSSQCPYRAEVTWKPICTGSCVNPQIKVTVKFLHQRSSSRSVALNTEHFAIELLK